MERIEDWLKIFTNKQFNKNKARQNGWHVQGSIDFHIDVEAEKNLWIKRISSGRFKSCEPDLIYSFTTFVKTKTRNRSGGI